MTNQSYIIQLFHNETWVNIREETKFELAWGYLLFCQEKNGTFNQYRLIRRATYDHILDVENEIEERENDSNEDLRKEDDRLRSADMCAAIKLGY